MPPSWLDIVVRRSRSNSVIRSRPPSRPISRPGSSHQPHDIAFTNGLWNSTTLLLNEPVSAAWEDFVSQVERIVDSLPKDYALVYSWRESVVGPFRGSWHTLDAGDRMRLVARVKNAADDLSNGQYVASILFTGRVVSRSSEMPNDARFPLTQA